MGVAVAAEGGRLRRRVRHLGSVSTVVAALVVTACGGSAAEQGNTDVRFTSNDEVMAALAKAKLTCPDEMGSSIQGDPTSGSVACSKLAGHAPFSYEVRWWANEELPTTDWCVEVERAIDPDAKGEQDIVAGSNWVAAGDDYDGPVYEPKKLRAALGGEIITHADWEAKCSA